MIAQQHRSRTRATVTHQRVGWRRAMAAGLTAVATLAFAPVAGAEPAPAPVDPGMLPGMNAMESLSPVVQEAAQDPAAAQQLLLAAASVLAGNSDTPPDSVALANLVSSFVADPPDAAPVDMPASEHIPAAGVVPGAEAHLPSGIDPANAVGPAVPEVVAPAPEVVAPAPEAVPPAPEVAAPAPEVAPPAPEAAVPAPEVAAPAPEVAAPASEGAVPAPAPGPAPGAFGPDAPPTQEFMYPSISNNCLRDGGNVIATALSVAGPATIPKPGPAAGQTAYVFTAVGTPAPAAEQKLPLNVTWVNLTTGASGTVALVPNPEINPAGPTTLVGIADTGSGSIMSTIFGQVTTVDMQCTFMPTVGSTVVP